MPLSPPVVARFWSYVDRSGDCWLWTRGLTSPSGYGRFKYWSETEGRWLTRGVHRISWELANGPIPDALLVRHRCDNPPCVRPDHLTLGDHAENMHDAVARGRHSGGGNRWLPWFQRYWSKIEVPGEIACWLWIGSGTPDGYGKFADWNGVLQGSHRIAWRLRNLREIPADQVVRHTCDVRRCVNPKHLLLGTHSDNTQDALTRGRHRSGHDGIHCRRGHVFTDNAVRMAGGKRWCAVCAEVWRDKRNQTRLTRRCRVCGAAPGEACVSRYRLRSGVHSNR